MAVDRAFRRFPASKVAALKHTRSKLTGLKLIAAAAVLLVGLVLTRTVWLTALGQALIHDDGPAKAEFAVVLGGDYWGNRILTAANLVRLDYVPQVLVSGPPGFYGANESDLAIQYAVRKGCPPWWFIPVPHRELNTRDEARALLEFMRRHHVHSFLLVTSNYHTARSRRIFLATERAMGGGPEMRMVAAPDQFFKADSWWRSRQSQKTFLMEWLKTITGPLGI
ncbi:MAG TPA: YdcF family protein [Candidatus Acidoferrales bacterium]|jgi:uncharacterized SAM-binding protein YcdF (DUF218 family)|nr:YdcF family protein [Candidatus Acidoferrales bacterium]